MAVLFAIFGALTLVGVVLTLKALFPRRSGDTRYCRKCRYNLTGLDLGAVEARCPECGSAVTEPKGVLRGERQRRPVWVVSGVICLLLGLAPLVVIAIGSLRQVDWYTYKPTNWVLTDIQSSDAKLAAKALGEMTRRWRADELTPEQVHRLAEACLAEQARPVERARVGVIAVGLLDKLYELDCLTDEQSQCFFAQMVQFAPLVRPVVVQGQPFYAGVRLRDRGPVNKYRVRVQLQSINVGESPKESFGGYGYSGYTGYSEHSLGRLAEFSRLGAHPVEVDLVLVISERGEDGSRVYEPLVSVADSSALYTDRRTIEGTVEIVAAEPPGLFKMTHSPELDQAVAGRISVSALYVDRDQDAVRGQVRFPGPHPIGLAFDVFADVGRERIYLGEVTASKDYRWGIVGWPLSFPIPEEVPEVITIILRSSEDVALRTPDLYEIWDGELWFEGIEVVRDQAPPSVWRSEELFAARVRRRDRSEGQSQWPVTPGVDPWLHAPLPLAGPLRTRLRSTTLPIEINGLPPDALAPGVIRGLIDDILAGRADSERTFRWRAREPERVDIGAMTPEERSEYFARIVEFSLVTRPVVVAGQEFYVGIDWAADVAPDQLKMHITVNDIRVGELRTGRVGSGLRTPLGFSPRGHGLTGFSTALGKYIELDEPGTWPIELDLEFEIHHADRPSTWVTDGSELCSGKRTLTGQIEVLAEEPPDLFKLTHSPELDRAVAAAVRATDFRPEGATWVNGRPQPGLSVQVWLYEPLPIGLAFDAYAEFGGQRLKAERAIIQSPGRKAGTSRGACVAFPYAGEPPGRVTLILRSSKPTATRTPDLYEIWDGELRFEDLPVLPGSDRERRFGDGRYVPTVRHPERSQSDAASDGEP